VARKEITYENIALTDPVDIPNPTPTADEDALSSLPQIPENQIDAPCRIILCSISGPFFQRHQLEYEALFPGLSITHLTQTRFIITYSEGDPYPSIEPWNLKKHGEFDNIPNLNLTPAQLQHRLMELGIMLFVIY